MSFDLVGGCEQSSEVIPLTGDQCFAGAVGHVDFHHQASGSERLLFEVQLKFKAGCLFDGLCQFLQI